MTEKCIVSARSEARAVRKIFSSQMQRSKLSHHEYSRYHESIVLINKRNPITQERAVVADSMRDI